MGQHQLDRIENDVFIVAPAVKHPMAVLFDMLSFYRKVKSFYVIGSV
jgi:hypothetical protein